MPKYSLRTRIGCSAKIRIGALVEPIGSRPYNLFFGIFSSLILLLGIVRYFWNTPSIFDLALDDELVYMGVGTDFSHLILWPSWFKGIYSSYEYGGLYSGLYGVLSAFLPDAIDLYFYGGVIMLLLALAAGFGSVLLLSGDVFLAVALAGPAVLSGELMIWPRVSFAAIALIGLALAVVAKLSSMWLKLAILLGAAYLAAFIRPEFVLSFYLFLALQLGLPVALLAGKLRNAPRLPLPTRGETMAILSAWASVGILSCLWSFPVLAADDRAFTAFGAHYAVQYAAQHKLGIEAWIDWRKVIDTEFPGAGSEFQAALLRPDKILIYFANNALELLSSIGQILAVVIGRHPLFSAVWVLCVAAWAMPAGRFRAGSRQIGLMPAPRTRLDVALILVFALPPLIATITIFPRHHYLVLLLFVASAALAALARPRRRTLGPALAIPLALSFLFAAAPLPQVPQPILQTALALRSQKIIHRMFEIDGGWCYLEIPRCIEDYAEWKPDGTPLLAYIHERHIDSIMLSPRLRHFEPTHSPGFAEDIDRLTRIEGWTAVDLGNDYRLLRAPG